MTGHCADCHKPLNGGDGVKVTRIVHKTCASDRETHAGWCSAWSPCHETPDNYDREWAALESRWAEWGKD